MYKYFWSIPMSFPFYSLHKSGFRLESKFLIRHYASLTFTFVYMESCGNYHGLNFHFTVIHKLFQNKIN